MYSVLHYIYDKKVGAKNDQGRGRTGSDPRERKTRSKLGGIGDKNAGEEMWDR